MGVLKWRGVGVHLLERRQLHLHIRARPNTNVSLQ